MKKNMLKVLFLILIIVICLIIVVKFYPFGSTEYDTNSKFPGLMVPKYTNTVEATDSEIVISSFRSSFILKKEMKDILKNYETYDCQNKYYYYIEESNITVQDFEIESWGLLNKVKISYVRGKKNGFCTKVTS